MNLGWFIENKKKPFRMNSNIYSTVQPLYWPLPSPSPASSKMHSMLQRKDIYTYLSFLCDNVTVQAFSALACWLSSMHQIAFSHILEKGDVSRAARWSAARCFAALSGRRNSLPNIKLLRGAVVAFYDAETNGGTSNHEWLLHTLSIMLWKQNNTDYTTIQHLYYSRSLFPINFIESHTTLKKIQLSGSLCICLAPLS